MRVALYLRVSVEDRAVSLEAQEAGGRAWSERNGHTVVDVFRDDGVSGAEWDRRHGVQRLRTAALSKPKPFDIVVVRDLDRLGRDGVRLPLLLVDLRDAGISVVEWTTGASVAVDGMALLLAQLRATMAQEERRAIAARTRVALEAKARQGLVVGGEVYGYRRDRREDGVHYLIDEAQADVVRDVFARRAAGETIRAIVHGLNGRGVPSPHAGRRGTGTWSPSAVHEMLTRDRYIGVLRWGVAGSEYLHGTRHATTRTGEGVVELEVPELAIVDRITWERVGARDCATRSAPGHARRPRHLLVGHAVCDACGGRIATTRTRVGTASVPAYVCGVRRDRAACEARWLRPSSVLDEPVLDWLETEVLTEDVVSEVVSEALRAIALPADETRLDELRAEERSLSAAVQRLTLAVESAADVGAVVDRLRAQDARLREVRAELSARLAAADREAPDEARVWSVVRELRDAVAEDTDGARDVLGMVLDGPLRIEWLGPRRGVRLRGKAVPALLLDLAESASREPPVTQTQPEISPRETRGLLVSPAGPRQSLRRVELDCVA